MKPSMQAKLDQLAQRAQILAELLAVEDVTKNIEQYRKLTREYAEIFPVITHYARWQAEQNNIVVAQTLLEDSEMRALAEEEIFNAKDKMEQLEQELQCLLLPKDPNDERNVFLEIRAGTGGAESTLFAADLLRMYLRFAERQRWKTEVISESVSDLGGYKEIILRIAGKGAYSKLKFESGGHRVQRVPVTETQGRIHTSACTVAVLAEADEMNEIKINPAELRVDTFRASGAGGQHVNKTDSAVRITHLPTGIVVECQDDRSQHRNRDQAMKVLAARIKNQQEQERLAKEASTRKNLIGSGDRSDRNRTYNFPQGRVTDHRINLTLYKIDAILDGDLEELLTTLTIEHQAELLANFAEGGL